MKKTLLFVWMLVALPSMLPAIDFSTEFGKVGKEEIEMQAYENDKSAEAVVIFDIGKSSFERNDESFDLVYERSTRIKVFNEAGIKWANVQIPFYRKGDIYEKISEIEAITYNFEDGVLNRTVFDVKNCYDEKLDESHYLKKFAIPNVKAGSIIEYHYKLYSEYIFNLEDWEFQWEIPVMYSKCIAVMVPFYQYTWLLQGASKFESQTNEIDKGLDRQFGPVKYQDMICEYVMKDVPAYKDEEFIVNKDDYIIKLDFQLSKVTDVYGSDTKVLSTWPELIKDMVKNDNLGAFATKVEKMAPKILDVKSFEGKTERQKFDTIMNFVKANYSWNHMNRLFTSKSLKTFLNDKQGNSAEINLLLCGLLKAAGISAVPVILSTREHGKVKTNYPFVNSFNYALVYAAVDGKEVLADATDPLLTNDRIPAKCMNYHGLMIQKDKSEWVNLQSQLPSIVNYSFKVDIHDNKLMADVRNSATDYDAMHCRKEVGTTLPDILKSLGKKGYTVKDSTVLLKDNKDGLKSYALNYSIENNVEEINGKIYISPFFNENMSENPLKQKTRTYPIDINYPIKRQFYSEIAIPKGYKVDFLPEISNIKNDQFDLLYQANSDDEKISVSLAYYFKQPVYPAADYLKVKYYFNEIVNKGAEKIVLVKK
jgi:hypothetical protein